jgi:putative tryptophan/tyrosine transport system substrate-binding protein
MTLPALVAAQSPPASVPRIGFLGWADGECDDQPFLRGLRELGYQPGETVAIECRTAGRHDEGLAPAAAELVQLGVDVIVTTSQPAGRAAHQVTETIPIVTAISGDPVAGGLARSLAKPGGNVTGVSYYATELSAKRLELLKDTLPGIATVDVLANPIVSYLPFEEDTRRAAGQLGIEVRIRQVKGPADLARAFLAMKADRAEAVFVLPDLMLAHEAPRIATLALEQRLPTMAWGGWFTEAGCLMAYSAPYNQIAHRLASYVDRILKGAAPGDLPIEQPTTFELSINLKTAKALGLEVPEAILLLADEVIE